MAAAEVLKFYSSGSACSGNFSARSLAMEVLGRPPLRPCLRIGADELANRSRAEDNWGLVRISIITSPCDYLMHGNRC